MTTLHEFQNTISDNNQITGAQIVQILTTG